MQLNWRALSRENRDPQGSYVLLSCNWAPLNASWKLCPIIRADVSGWPASGSCLFLRFQACSRNKITKVC